MSSVFSYCVCGELIYVFVCAWAHACLCWCQESFSIALLLYFL